MQNTEELEKLIYNMENKPPLQRLTHGFELTEEEQATVDKTVAGVFENGYAVVDGFFDEARLNELRDGMEPIFQMTGNRPSDRPGGWDGMQTVHVPNIYAKTRACDELTIDPVVLSVVEGILGVRFQMSAGTAMCPGPGSDSQGFHQDDGHWPIPRPHFPLVANVLFALDDFTAENGGTRLVPGSHKSAEPIPENPEFISLEMKAGSFAVWDGAIWHAGGGNKTKDQYRRTINLNYNLSWLRQQENQFLGVPREVIRKMPERLQKVLGYHRVNAVCGGVDYQDPLQYFNKYVSD